MVINQGLMNEALRKLLNAIAAEDGITIKFEQECIQAHATIDRVIHMPPPSAVDALEYWFLAYHELSHLLKDMRWSYTKLGAYVNVKDELSTVIANIIMDNLGERGLYGNYEGIDIILSQGRTSMVRKDWWVIPPAAMVAKESNPVESLVLGLMLEDFQERKDWEGHEIEALAIDKFDHCFTHVRKALRKLRYAERIKSILSHPKPEIPCGALVKDILSIIGYEPPPPEPQEGQGEGKCEACGGTGEEPGKPGEPCEACGGTGKEPSEGQGQGVSGDSGEGQGQGKEGDDGKPSDGADKHVGASDDYSLSESDPNHSTDGQGSGHEAAESGQWKHDDLKDINIAEVLKALNADLLRTMDDPVKREERYDKDRISAYVPWARNKVIELEKDYSDPRPEYRQAIVNALGDSTVSKQVSKYLKAMVSESYTYGQKRGKIHQKNVHRLMNKPQPGVQPSIFKRKNSSVLKTDSAVSLLVDCSGSMSGSEYAIAAACVVAMSETLTGLGVIHEILGFTEDRGLVSYVFKNFNTTLTKEKLLSIMASKQVRMYNNADGESVHWAAQRLLTRRESRKLLIVLSDGYPAGCFSGDGNAYLKEVCRTIEQESPIDLVGIGIRSDAVERFYEHHVVVRRTKDLDSVLFKVLKEFLL